MKPFLCFSVLFAIQIPVEAQNKAAQAATSVIYNPLFLLLLSIIILLLILIVALADVLKAAAYHRVQKEKAKKGEITTTFKSISILLLLTGLGYPLSAQTNISTVTIGTQSSNWVLDSSIFYLMISIIIFEILVAWALYALSQQLLAIREQEQQVQKKNAKSELKQPSFIEKINASVSIEKEADIMLDHNYDGIQELDNDLPPWWKYGFYLTIIVSVIYMIHFHISNTGKLQLAEYEEQLTQAKQDAAEYAKKASNLVDENNATALTDNESITAGKSIYMDNCAACHGKAAQGGVGPNLTDEYWMHKGGIKDIFKTIKYGYPEKGMKSWQQDLGAKQIHEVASYIKTLHGTNPVDPKEIQGELYKEEVANDSTKLMIKDSVQVVLK